MYNLNEGKNDELLSKCAPLSDYMALVGRIKKNLLAGMASGKAVDEAIQSCIDDGIMSELLGKLRSEVMDMCITEYNEKVFVDGIRAEGRVEGRAEGQNDLVNATQDARKGVSYEELVNIYGEETAKNAILIK